MQTTPATPPRPQDACPAFVFIHGGKFDGRCWQPTIEEMARWMFCNGMTEQQRIHSLRILGPESLSIVHEPVDRSRMPTDVPLTCIRTLRDHVLSINDQRRFVANLGGVDEVIELDACHNAMISEPAELASTLLQQLF